MCHLIVEYVALSLSQSLRVTIVPKPVRNGAEDQIVCWVGGCLLQESRAVRSLLVGQLFCHFSSQV